MSSCHNYVMCHNKKINDDVYTFSVSKIYDGATNNVI